MATGTIKGKGKPKGFQIIPEGEQVLRITNVEGIPRAAIKTVAMDMHNADGISLTGLKRKQTYSLDTDGGYAAFYYLVLNGLGIDLDEGDEFDISELEGIFVLVNIVHIEKEYEGKKPMMFANIEKVLGPGEPFETNDAPVSETASDDEEYE